MASKTYKPEEMVAKLRQVDVLFPQGRRPVAEAVRSIGVTPFTYCRWRRECGGLKTDRVKRLRQLEKKIERLRQAVLELTQKLRFARTAAHGFAILEKGRVAADAATSALAPDLVHKHMSL